jgi:hypothetical protein
MEPSASGQPMMDVVLEFFESAQWNVQKIPNKPVVRAGYRGERGTWVCYARVDENEQRFLFHSLMGLNIPPQYRAAVTEYLMRVNCTLPLGSFDIDIDTGEVRFKHGVEAPEGQLSVAMVRAVANACIRAMDMYFPGVVAVVHGGLSPEAAIARVEAQAMASAA